MAANMLRKFGFKKSEPRESEARLKLQKELFAFNTCVEHGFPHKPTALAYDPKLKIMAIGTKSGELRVSKGVMLGNIVALLPGLLTGYVFYFIFNVLTKQSNK